MIRPGVLSARRAARRACFAVPFAMLLVMAIAASRSCADTTATFKLNAVKFSDGSTASGTYTYDFTTGKTTAATLFADGAVFSKKQVVASASGLTADASTATVSYHFAFALTAPVTPNTSSTLLIDPAQSFFTAIHTSGTGNKRVQVTGGSVIPTTLLPTTTLSLAGTAGRKGWYRSATTVTLTAHVASGIANPPPVLATYYVIDAADQKTYKAPFVLSGEGRHTLKYWSVDQNGDSEPATTVPVKIDSVAPVTVGTVSGETLSLSATDATSGVAAITYEVDGGAAQTYSTPVYVVAVGQHTVTYQAADVAGNVEASQSATLVTTDTTPPTPPGNARIQSIDSGSITVAWDASTDNVAVAYYVVKSTYGHSGRGGGYTTITDGTTTGLSLSVGAVSGKYYNFTVYAVDTSGNVSGGSTTVYAEGPTAPTVYPYLYSGDQGPLGVIGSGFGILRYLQAYQYTPYTMYYTGSPAPTLSITAGPPDMTVDSASGIVSWNPSGTPGTYSATVQAANIAGSASYTFQYTVYPAGTDLLTPTAPGTPTLVSIGSTEATVTWPAAIDNVGVASYTITMENSGNNPPLFTFTTPTNATTYTVTGLPAGTVWYLRIYANDAAGNQGPGSAYLYVALNP